MIGFRRLSFFWLLLLLVWPKTLLCIMSLLVSEGLKTKWYSSQEPYTHCSDEQVVKERVVQQVFTQTPGLPSLCHQDHAVQPGALYQTRKAAGQCMWCLCSILILGIIWKEKEPNTQALEHAHSSCMLAMLGQPRLRWIGHVYSMYPSRLPKAILYHEMSTSSRCRGVCGSRMSESVTRSRQASTPTAGEEAAGDGHTAAEETQVETER